jgi:uncharacterized repeat protein (TIGR02543 family)
MKMNRKVFILVIVSLLLACDSSIEINDVDKVAEETPVTLQPEEVQEDVSYNLRYHLTHEDTIELMSYLAGEEITLLVANREGFLFDGWYLDEDLTIPLEFKTMPSTDLDLYPKWQLIEMSEPVQEEEVSESLIGITSRDDLAPVEICRLISTTGNTPTKVGFPLPEERLSSIGELNVQVFFIDFNDYQGVRSNEELEAFVDDYIEGIDNFYSTQSYGRLTFNWQLHPGYVRMNEQFYDYNFKRHRMDGTPQSNDLDYIIKRDRKSVV